jgi:flagellar hook assembly protein FlgD
MSFVLERDAAVRLDLFDVQGRRVRKLCDASYGMGAHSITWDGRDDGGVMVPSGVFFARFETGAFVQVRKLVRLEGR